MTTEPANRGQQIDKIMHDMDEASAAWVAAGYPFEGPEFEAREAVFARLRQWNVGDQPPSPLELVRQATARKLQADAADREWREAIKAAIAAGERVVDIAAAAGGIHVTRVYQIRDDRR
jgi:hypothetical protein